MVLFIGFKFSECKQESKCTILVSPGTGSGVAFFGTLARVKKVTSISFAMEQACTTRKARKAKLISINLLRSEKVVSLTSFQRLCCCLIVVCFSFVEAYSISLQRFRGIFCIWGNSQEPQKKLSRVAGALNSWHFDSEAGLILNMNVRKNRHTFLRGRPIIILNILVFSK